MQSSKRKVLHGSGFETPKHIDHSKGISPALCISSPLLSSVSPCNGFLTNYPAPFTPLRTCVNTIHEADLTSYGSRLVLGADNIVRLEDVYVYMKPIVRFHHDILFAASQLVDAVNRWHNSSSGPIEEDLTFTRVFFVISRPRDQGYDDMTEEDIKRADQAVENLQEEFSELLASSRSLPGDWDDDIWTIVWEEDVPNCPACEWKWTDHDLYEPYINTPSPASTPSPRSSAGTLLE
jgi:hypothetical protein